MDWLTLIQQARQGDKQSRDTIIEENMGLVHHIVKRFLNRGYDPEELFQIGCIGLMKAVDNFDTGYDVKFSTYAVPMIMGEIKRFLRDNGMIKVSRSLKENAWRIRQTRTMLEAKLGREPAVDEIAAQMELSVEEIIQAMEADVEVESLSRTVYQGDGNEICLYEKLADERDDMQQLVNHVFLQDLLQKLPGEDTSPGLQNGGKHGRQHEKKRDVQCGVPPVFRAAAPRHRPLPFPDRGPGGCGALSYRLEHQLYLLPRGDAGAE